MHPNSNRSSTHKLRLGLQRLLEKFSGTPDEPSDPKRGRLLLETLEKRQLLAGDVELLATDGEDSHTTDQSAETSSGLTSERAAEGELAPDLVQFAIDLAAAGVQFFGADFCPACTEQKELFEDGGDELPFIEVTNPDRTLNQIGIDEGISEFPTWVFPDDTRLVGVQSLATLSQRSGVAIPQSEQPRFEPIGTTEVKIGSPLHIPIDGYDPDGGPLTVTVSVQDPGLLEASVLSGNRSIRIDMQGYGDMVFELFEQRAPRASGRVIELAQADFYDGILFHRVDGNFVIQAGDPTATGSGGSQLGDFDDDFHPDLQHNRSGVLSFAKSTDDTNDSQFFITESDPRPLDFNHSVFGQLIEGEDVREAISSTSTPRSRGVSNSERPDNDIVIDNVEVFSDTENAVVFLKALGGTGSTNVTVTITDSDNNSSSETFLVNVVADDANSQPFLEEIPATVTSNINTPATLQLSSVDIENDAVTFFAQSLSSSANGSVSVNPTTGLVTVTPASGFDGTIDVNVGVQPGPGVVGNGSNDFDLQRVSFTFAGDLPAPTSIDLQTGSDTGSSNIDNITNAGSLTFAVDGVTDGVTVELVIAGSGAVVGSGVASGSTVTITTNNFPALGDGTYEIAARQRSATDTSPLSPSLTLVFDTTAPASVVASAATQANVGRAFQTDLVSGEEGSGLRYSLTNPPTGATIDATTGVINWTPTAGQLGTNTFNVTLTDAAGNTREESFNVEVADQPLAGIRLELTDLQGTPIDSVDVGQEFLMRFIGVDLRQFSFDRDGVFAAYADILFDSSLVRPVPGSTIDYADRFPAINRGTFSDGLIDELGAVSDRLVASELEESLIATVRFEALAPGTVNIRSEPADLSDSEVLLFGNDNQIPANAVEYGSATLAVGQGFTVGNDSFSVAEDSGTTTLDVLANDVVVSGSTTLSVISVTQPASGGTVTLEGGNVRFTPDADFNGT
ncbi:MAG: peptidylprolyl isomerase, partial [Pirellulales bacterium]|nr:peptidylprolyl isomerase [Pirellulales bacterium]